MAMKAVVTGANGQDGSYLCEYLLALDYEVTGVVRPRAKCDISNLNSVLQCDRFQLAFSDVTDPNSIRSVIHTVNPNEVYNLAALSYVGHSWNLSSQVFQTNTLGLINVLEACLSNPKSCPPKVYQASTSEMFGNQRVPNEGLNKTHRFNPCSLYGASKLAAHNAIQVFRDSYDLYAVSGILFNHESPRRGPQFVTSKVCRAAAEWHLHLSDKRTTYKKPDVLKLGNPDARRDWGYAPDYVRGMHLMLQEKHPRDFILATGEDHSVEELCEWAFDYVSLDYKELVEFEVDEHLRPNDLNSLKGDPTQAKLQLGWEPTHSFHSTIAMMVDHYIELLQR